MICPFLECFVFIPQKIILKMKFLHVTKSKFEFKHDLKFMATFKKSFVPKKDKNQSMSVVQEEQNINLIFMEIGQGQGFLMGVISKSFWPGFHWRPYTAYYSFLPDLKQEQSILRQIFRSRNLTFFIKNLDLKKVKLIPVFIQVILPIGQMLLALHTGLIFRILLGNLSNWLFRT